MEAIQQDLMKIKLQEQKNEYQSLQDICGQNMDGSYSDQMQFVFTNATNMISIGGLKDLVGGQSVNIQFNMDNSLIHLDRSFFVGELILTDAVLHNYLDLIRPTQSSMGSVSIPYTNGQFLVRQKLMRMDAKKMRKYAKQIGLLLDHSTKTTQVTNANTIYQDYESLFLQHKKWEISDTNQSNEAVIKFALPLHLVFPNLQGLDEKTLWCGVGQSIQLQGQLNQNSDCLIVTGNAPNYKLQNCGLMYCYSKVPQTVGDLVLKSRISIPKLRHIWFGGSLQNFGNTVNLQFNVNRKERIRYLYFAFHPNSASSNTTSAVTGNTENMITNRQGVYSRLHYPLQSVKLPLQQIQVDIAGRIFTVQQSALQLLHIVDDSNKYQLQVHPAEQVFSQVYCLDLRRFTDDLYGSSSLEQGIVRVAITIQTGIKSIYGQDEPWSTNSVANDVCSINAYQIHSFLEVFSECHIENGIYV